MNMSATAGLDALRPWRELAAKHCVITGHPGSGRSAIARALVNLLLQVHGRIEVLFIDAADGRWRAEAAESNWRVPDPVDLDADVQRVVIVAHPRFLTPELQWQFVDLLLLDRLNLYLIGNGLGDVLSTAPIQALLSSERRSAPGIAFLGGACRAGHPSHGTFLVLNDQEAFTLGVSDEELLQLGVAGDPLGDLRQYVGQWKELSAR